MNSAVLFNQIRAVRRQTPSTRNIITFVINQRRCLTTLKNYLKRGQEPYTSPISNLNWQDELVLLQWDTPGAESLLHIATG
jgi:hypothetical protein